MAARPLFPGIARYVASAKRTDLRRLGVERSKGKQGNRNLDEASELHLLSYDW